MNEFKERYQKHSNIELVRIIRNPKSYQPLAVEAAENTLNSRNLSPDEMKDLNAKVDHEIETKLTAELKRKEFENKMMSTGNSIFSAINPVRENGTDANNIILSVSFLIGLVSVLQLSNNIGMLFFMFGGGAAKWDLSVVLYVFSFILPIVAVVLFALRKSIGWFLMAMFLIFSITGNLRMLYISLSIRISDFDPINNLYPRSSAFIFTLTLLFYLCLLWLISKKEILNVFSISYNSLKKILSTLTVISLLMMFLLMGKRW